MGLFLETTYESGVALQGSGLVLQGDGHVNTGHILHTTGNHGIGSQGIIIAGPAANDFQTLGLGQLDRRSSEGIAHDHNDIHTLVDLGLGNLLALDHIIP